MFFDDLMVQTWPLRQKKEKPWDICGHLLLANGCVETTNLFAETTEHEKTDSSRIIIITDLCTQKLTAATVQAVVKYFFPLSSTILFSLGSSL